MQELAPNRQTQQGKYVAISLFNCLFLLCSSLFCATAQANSAQEYKNKLNAIGGEISTIKKKLNQTKGLYKSEQDKVFQIEKEIASVKKQLKQGQNDVVKVQEKISKIEQQRKVLDRSHASTKEAFKKLIVSTYKSPPPSRIEMLLQQNNPYALGRLENYYGFYTEAVKTKLAEINEQLKEKQTISDQYNRSLEQLAQQQAGLDKQTKALNKKRKERSKSVNKLAASLSDNQKRLDKLTKDRGRLNTLLSALKRERERLRKAEEQEIERAKLANTPSSKQTVQRRVFAPLPGGFNKQKGRLAAPVTGKQVYGFGKRIPESGMTSEGILYSTGSSVAVHSVYSGRVIFADWLKGFGRLIIVDHGDDHISLYGHNDALNKSVGDMVKTNEVIARSGTSGGQKKPSLYFEIRNKTNPVNPKIWLN